MWGGRLATLAPPIALLVYAACLTSRAVALSAATFLNSDAPEAAYLGLALPGGVSLPVHTEILPTLLAAGLIGLPGGHPAIQLLGPLLGLATVGVMSWTVRRLGGPWIATAVAGVAAGPILLWSVLFPTAHVVTFLTAALLAAYLAELALGRGCRSLLIATGTAAGIALIGDQAFLATGLAPMLAGGGALWLVRRNRRHARSIAGVLVVVAAVAAAGEVTLHLAGVRFVGNFVFGAVGLGAVPIGAGAGWAAQSLGQIVGGQWSGSVLHQPWDDLTFLAGIVVPLVAPAALLRQLRHRRGGDVDDGRVAYLVFWTTADVLVLAVYLLFGYAASLSSAHYLLPCLLSAVATLPFVVAPHRRNLPLLAAAALALVQAVGILLIPALDYAGTYAPTDGPRVVALVKAAGLTRGYADYWESHPLTWLSGDTVHVYPVVVRGCTATQNVCPYLYSGAAWYRAVPGSTFLILRRSWFCVSVSPTGVLGPPEQTIVVNSDTTILVYNYDIASRFASLVMDACHQ